MTEYNFTHSSFGGMRNVWFSSAFILLSETRACILCLNAHREDLTQVHKYCQNLGHTNNTQFKLVISVLSNCFFFGLFRDVLSLCYYTRGICEQIKTKAWHLMDFPWFHSAFLANKSNIWLSMKCWRLWGETEWPIHLILKTTEHVKYYINQGCFNF